MGESLPEGHSIFEAEGLIKLITTQVEILKGSKLDAYCFAALYACYLHLIDLEMQLEE